MHRAQTVILSPRLTDVHNLRSDENIAYILIMIYPETDISYRFFCELTGTL